MVDVRHYPYRDNFAIQNWINHTYIPQIIECDVKRYAFVVEKIITSSLEDIQKYYDFSHDDMIVKYFESHEEAVHWVEAKE
ncbi:MAG: hypothetical protein HC811_10440 [Flammeovirgaceae bacterium]|nr:hypothetical protein [Flammeovirgaceae bacterium]